MSNLAAAILASVLAFSAPSAFAQPTPASAPPKMLAAGTLAPEFTVQDKNGSPVRLSDFRGKIVVLDFWATWCGVCLISLHYHAANAKKHAGKDVVVLAVDVWDAPGAFTAWVPRHPEYSGLRFVTDPTAEKSKGVAGGLYGVTGLPTQYVIGKDGKIVNSIVGFDSGNRLLKSALKAAGAQ